MEGPQV